MSGITLLNGGRAIALTDKAGKRRRFHALWLRDNARDDATRSPGNGQKLLSVADIPADIAVTDGRVEAGRLILSFTPTGERLSFDMDWLFRHAYDRAPETDAGWLGADTSLWAGGTADQFNPLPFDQVVRSTAGLRRWLEGVRRHGIGILTGGPTESGALLRIADLFGYVRETNYGKWFDVRTVAEPTNLAYTGLGLQAHTDNPYRDPVPTLQILYCLENAAEGGDSLVVDGFSAVRRLRQENPDGFRLLSRYCARFEYSGSEGVRLRARRPMIELSPDGELIAVRFNSRSIAAIEDVPFDEMDAYYGAYRHFAAIIDDPAMAVTFKLAPGDSFIVDNTRVLHARTAFTGAGNRWLQGCYPDKDGLLSTLAALESRRDAA